MSEDEVSPGDRPLRDFVDNPRTAARSDLRAAEGRQKISQAAVGLDALTAMPRLITPASN